MKEDTENTNSGGIYDTGGMFDSLIVDCDALLKLLFEGQRVAFCGKMIEIIQKICTLKDGVIREISEKEETIRRLGGHADGGDLCA